MALDSSSKGHSFISWLFDFCIMYLGKLFSYMYEAVWYWLKGSDALQLGGAESNDNCIYAEVTWCYAYARVGPT